MDANEMVGLKDKNYREKANDFVYLPINPDWFISWLVGFGWLIRIGSSKDVQGCK